MPKRFKLKIFSADGVTHLVDINPQTMETLPRFLSTIQSGAGQMGISYLAEFDNFGEGVTIKNGVLCKTSKGKRTYKEVFICHLQHFIIEKEKEITY